MTLRPPLSAYMRRKLRKEQAIRRYEALSAMPACTVAVVDCRDPTANMYGCQPCPVCASTYRAQFAGSGLVECDDCGYRQLAFVEDRR